MHQSFLDRLEKKAGIPGVIELLADRLSGSDLNSVLLEVYRRKSGRLKPAELLSQYRQNRLVKPSQLDMIGLLESELRTLRFFRDRGFQSLELSPVALFGSCSAVATVSQDKVITAIRNTEVVSDATNMLALHIADMRAGDGKVSREGVIRLATVHRHVRTQPFGQKGFLPHFKIGCLVTSGMDTGNYGFECSGMMEHLEIWRDLLSNENGVGEMRLILKKRKGYAEGFIDRLDHLLRGQLEGLAIEREDVPAENSYYQGVQFKLMITIGGKEWEIADGGFVDWTQQLLGNKKERLLIGGFGLELLYKIQNGLL